MQGTLLAFSCLPYVSESGLIYSLHAFVKNRKGFAVYTFIVYKL